MNLHLNGESRPFDADVTTVARLLESLGLAGKPLVVELDREPVFPADYGRTLLRDGAAVEIVVIAAGG